MAGWSSDIGGTVTIIAAGIFFVGALVGFGLGWWLGG